MRVRPLEREFTHGTVIVHGPCRVVWVDDSQVVATVVGSPEWPGMASGRGPGACTAAGVNEARAGAPDGRRAIRCTLGGKPRVLPLVRERSFELPLVHLRTAADSGLAGLVVELPVRPPALPGIGSEPSSPRRGDIANRRPAGSSCFSRSGSLLVDRPRRDLFGTALRNTSVPRTPL